MRVAAKTGVMIPKPIRENLIYVNRTKDKKQGLLDTDPEDVLLKTYKGENFMEVYNEFQEFIRQKNEKEKLITIQ